MARHGVRHARDRHPPRPARRCRTRGCGARDVRPQRTLPQADFVALTCPLTAETQKLIDADALRREAVRLLLNAARGRVVDEPALVDALARRQIRGAALDVTVEEPLPAASPLWAMENVLITPHTAGETCRYEDNVLAIMQENLARLWRGETELLNQVV